MELIPIDDLDVKTTQGHTSKFEALPYVGLQILMTAQKAATVISKDVMGKVRVTFRGEEIVNSVYSACSNYADLLFGMVDEEQGAAGDNSYYGCFIPFFHPRLASALHKRVGDTMNFYIEKAQESCDSAVVEVYGLVDDVPELYTPKFLTITETAPKGKIILDRPNLGLAMITKPATTAFTTMQLLIDAKLKMTGSYRICRGMTHNLARKEASALDVVLFDMVQKGQINESLADSATLQFTGGVGDFDYTTVNFLFNRSRTIQTAAEVNADRDYNIRQKMKRAQTAEGAAVSIIRNPWNKSQTLVNEVEQATPALSSGANIKKSLFDESLRIT